MPWAGLLEDGNELDLVVIFAALSFILIGLLLHVALRPPYR
ncbi:hypothetical protein [Amycolatopsis solani]|nr:hypothetical protein [Amycolatopsis sp. MEP2-6]